MRAVKVHHEKVTTAEGIIVETKVWAVQESESYP